MWRYYAQRAGSKAWLDTNVQLADVNLTWANSASMSGSAQVPSGLADHTIAEDGRPVWGKWDTLLYAEEDEQLKWVGICNAVWPDGANLKLEFIGSTGWLQRVPFLGDITAYKENVFNIVRQLVNSAQTTAAPYNVPIIVSTNLSALTVGDPVPPPEPQPPVRAKGQTMDAYQGSAAYKAYEAAKQTWDDTYGSYAPYTLGWWEGQYVGEEIDQLAKQLDFEYHEWCEWADRGHLIPRFHLDLADDIVRRRNDIAFIDGMNIAQQVAPRDGNQAFANSVIGLGAGEGRDMVRKSAANNDGRLYQAQFLNYKEVRDGTRLQGLINADLRQLGSTEYDIDKVVVWDVAGFSPISTLAPGDEVKVQSPSTQPPIDSWRRIVEISRNPEEPFVTLSLEYAT